MKKVFYCIMFVLLFITLVLAVPLSSCKPAEEETAVLKLGLIVPLSGPFAGTGVPSTRGFEVFADDINARGGIKAGGKTYTIEPVFYDDKGYIPSEALKAAKKGMLEDGVNYFLTTSTTAVVEAIAPFVGEHDGLVLTWGAGWGIKPEWPHVIGAFVMWPNYSPLSFEYMAEHHPEVKRVAFTCQDAAWAIDELAWATVASETTGMEIIFSELHSAETIDWYPIVTAMLAEDPDLIDIVAPPSVTPLLMEAAKALGYQGMWYVDHWDIEQLLERVPAEYFEGGIGPKPNPSDPAIVGQDIFRLYEEYQRRWPGEWYGNASDPWYGFSTVLKGIELADSIDPVAVRKALLSTNPIEHPLLGASRWGGKELYGIDNFLMTPQFVGQVVGGEFRPVEKRSFADWYDANKDALVARMKAEGYIS